jgi:hypothetical protein
MKPSKDKLNDKAAFILKASLCRYNCIWKCMHPKNKGNECLEICENYEDYRENGKYVTDYI